MCSLTLFLSENYRSKFPGLGRVICRNLHYWNQGRCQLGLSLPVAKLMVGLLLFFLPIGTYQFYNLTIFGLIFFASQFPSSHCQFPTVITIDRYYKISYHINLQYKAKVTTRKCFVVILSVWFFSTTFATFDVILYDEKNKVPPVAEVHPF